MPDSVRQNQCIYHIYDGLREGLSHFSQPSRVALIYAVSPEGPVRIYDPQYLLQGHEPKLRELYVDSEIWREKGCYADNMQYYEVENEDNLQLTGLISFGGRSRSLTYQMWFTEHHPDMCSAGPTERWLEHAVWLLSQDMSNPDVPCIGTAGYVLREYATHAVRDFIVDERSALMGWDTQIRIYPTLDAILGISETFEEGVWPRGELVFAEPGAISEISFLVKFPYLEQPSLRNFKHVRKLLLSTENSERKLISDGKTIVGIATGDMPEACIFADFRGGHGYLRLNGETVCSFFDGKFHSSTRKAKLVQVEEALLESGMDSGDRSLLFKITSAIVHSAQELRHGCTLVLDLNQQPIRISGQHMEEAPDLSEERMLELARALSKVDGALHIGKDLRLHGFACLLDGYALKGEDRARGARYNSALRFTAMHDQIITVVVSADRPVSVIQGGLELTARCEWRPVYGYMTTPPLLADYIQ
ncbi:MAG: DNA integrity scanning protein DisA nucleotide-binding domain protein [Desulfococcaceae bacterium]|jgi:hypothetical protein|nr:DNA integrity scanning protein DisA nucleotide-binding domain protein [Desulfococcaceae bacterium]